MVVVKSGHIQSFVNPAETARYGYRDAPPTIPDPDQWLSGAAEHEGSWWLKWAEWLIPRSGPRSRPRPNSAAVSTRRSAWHPGLTYMGRPT